MFRKIFKILFSLALVWSITASCNNSPPEKDEVEGTGDNDYVNGSEDKSNSVYEPIHGSSIDTNKHEVIPNPEVTLDREFWVVVKDLEKDSEGEGVCFFSPRPDNNPTAAVECAEGGELAEKLEKYDFCREAVRPEVINNIPCDIALEISTLINNALVFTEEWPYPTEGDKAEACAIDACAEKAELDNYCDYYTGRYNDSLAGKPVTSIARLDTEEEIAAILPCLNELYGVN